MSAWPRLMLFHDASAEEGMTARLVDHDEYMAMLVDEWADQDCEPINDDPERDAALLTAIETGEIDEYLHWLTVSERIRRLGFEPVVQFVLGGVEWIIPMEVQSL